jgi:hypothetical protein
MTDTGFGPTKGYEVVWMHESDERNWDNQLGGGMESPRPLFADYKSAYEYCNESQLKSRAIILEYRKGVREGWEDEYEVVKDTKWGVWE